MSGSRPTLADVARRAGVAPSTASAVFSGRAPVAAATRQRVQAAAAELGYAGPDPRAASLRRGRSGIVGVVFAQPIALAFHDPVFAPMMDALADEIAPTGAGLLLLREREPDGAASLASAPVDAAVLITPDDAMRELVPTMRARGVPLVSVEGLAAEGIPAVLIDNSAGQEQAARHLRGLGHREVAVLSLPPHREWMAGWLGPEARVSVDVTADRLDGVRRVFPDAPVYAADRNSIDAGGAAGHAILANPHRRPTAVIAQSDLLAAGVIRAAADLGIAVPGQLSVTGFDGIAVDGLAPHLLTTVVQSVAEKGRVLGRMVTDLLADRPVASLVLSCEFRAGTTTGPAPRAG